MGSPTEPAALAVRSCLVLGGARSGKSAHAQALAEGSGLSPVYLATADIWDAEMESRVALHRAARDGRWRTVEEPLALSAALGREAVPGSLVVVDCLTLWLTNLMLGGHDIEKAVQGLAACLGNLPAPVILVSNEVGGGIVPDNRLGREFRDAQGRLNQSIAQVCDTVVLVTAGQPLMIKPAVTPRLVF
ncbi:bifunctional adenosylcobinamide kinase/adenosylcobinamide-phosphate guanylyltransferase [Lichenifustis flavocetrariae]|uniref:bifunctional adenosylcobinamide kinase/adenosylcobinamide-phosphate guanylyltransferase n=1 Tax=Lichenifustis flavocetrariae TaxID=2949735 RepID=UPI003D0BBC08